MIDSISLLLGDDPTVLVQNYTYRYRSSTIYVQVCPQNYPRHVTLLVLPYYSNCVYWEQWKSTTPTSKAIVQNILACQRSREALLFHSCDVRDVIQHQLCLGEYDRLGLSNHRVALLLQYKVQLIYLQLHSYCLELLAVLPFEVWVLVLPWLHPFSTGP